MILKIDEFFLKLISKSDETTFTLINPFMIREYDFEIPEYFRALLDIKDDTNILVLNIMIIATPIEAPDQSESRFFSHYDPKTVE